MPREIAIIGARNDPATRALLETVFHRYLPNKVVVGGSPESLDQLRRNGLDFPLLEDRGMLDGQPTAYVCQNYACQLPVNQPEALAQQLEV
jgi:uncharacterized protein YyaL (SSP411 family)